MKPRAYKKLIGKQEVKVGSVVIAKPFWRDENYSRSVIFLLEHDKNGSAGVIVNKPSTLTIHDALPELNLASPLFYGGPSEIKTVSYLHNNSHIPESIYIGNELFWGGDYDVLVEALNSGKINLRNVKFCAGFVQWSAGQLESEVDEGKWWLDYTNPQELFVIFPENLWAEKLIGSGHVYGLLNDVPDPAVN